MSSLAPTPGENAVDLGLQAQGWPQGLGPAPSHEAGLLWTAKEALRSSSCPLGPVL